MLCFFLASCLLTACSQDVSIMKIPNNEDTAPATATDTQHDTFHPQDSGTIDISAFTAGFAKIHFQQVACPACLGVTQEINIAASLKLHLPTSADYTAHLTDVGTCTTSIYETHVSSQPLGSNQVSYFNDIPLSPAVDGWENSGIYDYQYSRNTQHTISSEHGDISNAFTSIEGFDSIEPYTLLWVDPSYAYDAVISKSGTTFTWSPTRSDLQFEIIIAVYSSDGSQLLGAVSCMETDSGSMYIPGSYFQSFPAHSLTAVHLRRHQVDAVPVNSLGGNLQSHMMWEVIGTGHIE